MSNIDLYHGYILHDAFQKIPCEQPLSETTPLSSLTDRVAFLKACHTAAQDLFKNYDIPPLEDFEPHSTLEDVVFFIVQSLARQRRERVYAHLAGRSVQTSRRRWFRHLLMWFAPAPHPR